MKKALIYSRVSTEEQAKDGRHSLKTQRRLCEKAIEDSGEYKLASDGVFEDPGRTATNMNRPALQDLLIRVQEDKSIGAVFVQDTDRLARNVGDHLTIKAMLKKQDATLFSVSQPNIKDDAEGRMMDLIVAGFNQFQSDITSRKTIKSLENKFNGGDWITRAPLGYLNVGEKNDEDKRTIIVDKEKASLIAEFFKVYATGTYSVFELREKFYKKGLTGFTGRKMAKATFFRILDNPFYYGEMRWRGLVKKGNHKPLITKELFDRCQQVKAERNRFARRDRKYNFPFNGMIFSATTGMRYVGEQHPNKSKSYYRCHGKGDLKSAPEDKPIAMDIFEGYVEDAFRGIEFSAQFVDKVVARVKQIYEKKKKSVTSEKVSLINKKFSFQKKLEVAEEKLISGTLSDSDFTRIKDRLRENIDNVEDELCKLNRSRNIKIDVIQKLLILIRNIGEAYEKAPTELKRAYLGLFWEKFEVTERHLVNAEPTKIVKALIATGAICLDKRQKPIPIGQVFANLSPSLRENIGIRNIRGD